MLHIIKIILVSLAAGFLARFLMPGKDKMGWILTALLGLAGGFVAEYLGRYLKIYQADEPAGFIATIIGAILVLVVYRFLFARNH